LRGLIAVATQQQAVGQAAQQLRQVDAATAVEIGQCLLLHVRCGGGGGGQFGIGLAGAGEHDQLAPLGAPCAAVRENRPLRPAVQYAQHDHLRAASSARSIVSQCAAAAGPAHRYRLAGLAGRIRPRLENRRQLRVRAPPHLRSVGRA
jgi:hypothetical protein